MLKVSRRLIDVTGMTDIIQRRIPVLSLASQAPGPTVWLSGCIHGDEPGGAVIIHDLVRTIRAEGMTAGTLHALPLINPMGFENVSRFINSDREDLNRCFPGDPKGTMGERIARRLFDQIMRTQPDLVIDLHNDWIQSVPYVLIDPRELYGARGLQSRTIELARRTGLLLVQESETNPEFSRTLTGALVAAGVPAFTVEAGGAGSIVETSVAAGVTAVLGVLAHLGMLPEALAARAPKASPRRVLDYTSQPLCTSSGIVRFAAAPGDEIAAGQKVASVYSAFGALEETLRASRSGILLGVADHARTVPGAEVVAIAELRPGDGPERQRAPAASTANR